MLKLLVYTLLLRISSQAKGNEIKQCTLHQQMFFSYFKGGILAKNIVTSFELPIYELSEPNLIFGINHWKCNVAFCFQILALRIICFRCTSILSLLFCVSNKLNVLPKCWSSWLACSPDHRKFWTVPDLKINIFWDQGWREKQIWRLLLSFLVTIHVT